MRRALTPLKKSPKPRAFAVCDIEAADWRIFVTIGWYSGKGLFKEFSSLHDFFLHLFNEPEDVIYAHFGGIYDFNFLLEFVLGSDVFNLDGAPLARGSGLLSLRVECDGRNLEFRDSSALLPFALETVTKTFKVEHVKGHFDFELLRGQTRATLKPEILDTLVRYLRIDCIGLYEVLLAYSRNPHVQKTGVKLTRSSQALAVFRTFLKEPLPACPLAVDAWVRKAYAGGRTEIFRPFYESETVPLNVYDVQSMYPSVMRDFDMPTQFAGFSQKVDLDKIGFGYFEMEVPEDNYVPILWTRESGKFIFPVGRVSGVYPLCEVKAAISLNRAKILKTGKIAYFKNGGRIFEDYVNTLYAERSASKDAAAKILLKDFLNHLYGRTGLRLLREQLEFDDGQAGVKPFREIKVGDKIYGLVKKEVRLRSFSNVAIAAWVTGLARLRLYDRILSPTSGTVHYTDTDSGYTTQVLLISDALGGLKWEGDCLQPGYCDLRDRREVPDKYQACFLLPKTYIAGSKIAMKGFPNRKIKHMMIEDFEEGLSGDLRAFKIEMEARGLNKFRTGLMKGDLLSLRTASTKQIKARYSKRQVFRDSRGNWETRPLVLE